MDVEYEVVSWEAVNDMTALQFFLTLMVNWGNAYEAVKMGYLKHRYGHTVN